MKTKVTVTLDENIVPAAKRYAQQHGLSLSGLIENTLREHIEPVSESSFSSRWRGNFRPAEREDSRYAQLADKYL